LRIDLDSGSRRVAAAEGISFRIDRGETFGLVGESGCGKSITALALIGLFAAAAVDRRRRHPV